MDRPFRRHVALTEEERLKFQELVRGLGPTPMTDPVRGRLGRMTRWRMTFWRHRSAATLLVPVGVLVMMVAVVYWWPLGLLGAGALGVGLSAANGLAGDRLKRRRLSRRRPGSGPS